MAASTWLLVAFRPDHSRMPAARVRRPASGIGQGVEPTFSRAQRRGERIARNKKGSARARRVDPGAAARDAGRRRNQRAGRSACARRAPSTEAARRRRTGAAGASAAVPSIEATTDGAAASLGASARPPDDLQSDGGGQQQRGGAEQRGGGRGAGVGGTSGGHGIPPKRWCRRFDAAAWCALRFRLKLLIQREFIVGRAMPGRITSRRVTKPRDAE